MEAYNGGINNGGVDWEYFDKYEYVDKKYLPYMGEGDNMATQIVTAVAKLVYKWYNDGDVFDNTHGMRGWANDLSSYANWLDKHTGVSFIFDRIYKCHTDDEYEHILKDMCDLLEGSEEYLEMMSKREKVGSVYFCDGRFKFVDCDEDEDEWYSDEEEEEEYEEE